MSVFSPYLNEYVLTLPATYDADGNVLTNDTVTAVLTTPDNDELRRVLPDVEVGREGAQFYLGTADSLPAVFKIGLEAPLSIDGQSGTFLVRYIYTDPFKNANISALIGRQFIGSFTRD